VGNFGERHHVLLLAGGRALRYSCVVEAAAPHRITSQFFAPALARSTHSERVVERDGRSVHVRDFGGDGPLVLMWHGGGCDASVWEAMVPHLRSYRVVAQDLPGHGGSPLASFSVSDVVADTQAVLAELGFCEPILVGHSMGGWAALHYAATRPCRALVCLDGPATLDYAGMGLTADHPAFAPDPSDVPADLGSLSCPTMIVLCRGTSSVEEETYVPFRVELSNYLANRHPGVRVEWLPTSHMLVLTMPEQTAALIQEFLLSRGIGS